ncbi:MAG: isocitrate lyase/phosphoenolpyruvate mutase family protein [Solirubrobacterales bacterium]
MAATQQQKGEAFRALHEGEPFVIPNPWDAGSAKVLEGLGFRALATTSGGFALTLGKTDGAQTLQETVAHVRALSEATDLPISVDLENGYGPAPQDAARAIAAVAEAGAVGGSIEDWDRDEGRLYELEEATERIDAAVDAARSLDFRFTLTARAENFLRGNPNLEDTIARLRAYEQAGADVIYAPRLTTAEQIRAICDAASKPVNVLAFAALGLSFAEISAAGAQRVSVGGWLSYTAMNAAVEVAERIRDEGDFSGLVGRAQIEEWQLG